MKRTLALLILLLIPMVSGELVINKYTNEFALSSMNNEQLKMCSCETRVDTFLLENTGQFDTNYELEVQSNYPEQIRLSERRVHVPPGHAREILVYIENSCGISGTFDYVLIAVNSYGRVRTVEKSVNIGACATTMLQVTPEQSFVGLCEPAVFEATVTNVGTFPESYLLSFGTYDNIASLPIPEMYLQPGQAYTQNVTFQFSCEDHGSREIPFTVAAGKSRASETITRTFEITNEYDYTLSVPASLSVCADTTTHATVEIRNAIEVPNEVTLTIDAPQFIIFASGNDQETLRLPGNGSAIMPLSIAPGKYFLGSHEVTVKSKDLYGGIHKDRSITIDVISCYDPNVEIRVSPELPARDLETACCGPATYYVNVRNDGVQRQTFGIELNAPSNFVLDDLTVQLDPQQNVNIPLRANLPCADDSYDVEVSAFPIGSNVRSSDKFTVQSLGGRSCHMVDIIDDEITVRQKTTTIPIIVVSTGISGGNYTVLVNSSLFKAIEESIEVSSGESATIHLSADLVEQPKGRYVVHIVLTNEEGIAYNEFVTLTLQGPSLLDRTRDGLTSINQWPWCVKLTVLLIVCLALLLLILVLIYAGKITPPNIARHKLMLLKTIIAVALVLLIIALLFLPTPGRGQLYDREAQYVNATVYEWYQDEPLSIDLGKYFSDPDQDVLVFNASTPRNIAVDINGTRLTLQPDPGFSGSNSITITASDGFNVATSPAFALHVIARRNLSFVQWIDVWCKQIVALVLIGMLVILLLGVFTIREKRQDLRGNNVIVVPRMATAKRRRKTKKVSKKVTKRVKRRSSQKRSAKKVTKSRALQGKIVRDKPAKSDNQTVNIQVNIAKR